MLIVADGGQVSDLCLLLLDLYAAFDTVDHDLLMLRLLRQFGLKLLCSSGLTHNCLVKRFKSYMETVRHQSSTPCAPYHNVMCSVRVCVYCTLWTLKTTYTMECCILIADITCRQHLRSASSKYRVTSVQRLDVGPSL